MSENAKVWLVAIWSILIGVIALLTLLTLEYICIAFALTGLAVGVFGLRLTEGSSARGVRVAMKVGIGINGLLASLLSLVFAVSLLSPFPHRLGPLAQRTVCMGNLHGLGKAMMVYARDTGRTSYPTPDKWCDLLLDNDYATARQLICKAEQEQGDIGRCHYAMNPDCEPNSPPDVVLLFETEGGWNQYGGPEILTTENHGGKGCNIVFNDTSVKFVPPQELAMLKWKVEEEKK
jgi:hypothetical protein